MGAAFFGLDPATPEGDHTAVAFIPERVVMRIAQADLDEVEGAMRRYGSKLVENMVQRFASEAFIRATLGVRLSTNDFLCVIP